MERAVKFVCDKCKTRYSIGEDRVRGKILKIRCKNCANVITVREGMEAPPPSETGDPGRPSRPTTGAPPAALNDEWYVSIDGVQSGPLSLQAAQKWVASKPFDAELHCWNEGFEDWLAVDKVSHFRNLRQRPAPPPPRPRAASTPPPMPEKPLFAATMAAIEKEASGPARSQHKSAPAVPSLPRGNGMGVPPMGAKPVAPATPALKPVPPVRSSGVPAANAPPIPSSRTSAPANKFPAPAVHAKSPQPSSSAAALAAAFRPDDGADALTAVNAPSFVDEPATVSDQLPARARNMFDFGESSAPSPEPLTPPRKTVQQALESDDDDDGLSIGEVSRVVKLADLAPKPKASGTGNTAAVPRVGGGTASVARVPTSALTGSQPRLSPSELGMKVDPALASGVTRAGEPAADESVVARSFAEKHRRGLMALIAVSALLVLGVIGVVFWVVSKSTNETGGGLGGMKQIDTSRPEDIVRKQLPIPAVGSGSAQITQATRPRWPTGRNTNPTNPIPEDPGGNSLQASEIEDMAAKQGEGTKRCYMRAQKGAMGFEIADVKKISVTLAVNKDGAVTDVQLSSQGNNSFGQCLVARIKAWKFRTSPSGGTFRISLAFSS